MFSFSVNLYHICVLFIDFGFLLFILILSIDPLCAIYIDFTWEKKSLLALGWYLVIHVLFNYVVLNNSDPIKFTLYIFFIYFIDFDFGLYVWMLFVNL